MRALLIETLEMCYDLAVMLAVKEVRCHEAGAKHTIVYGLAALTGISCASGPVFSKASNFFRKLPTSHPAWERRYPLETEGLV